MARLSKPEIVHMLIKRVCENKNVNFYVRKNYFINIYRHIPGYYDKFVETTKNIFSIHGHDEEEAVAEIDKYFGINTSIN